MRSIERRMAVCGIPDGAAVAGAGPLLAWASRLQAGTEPRLEGSATAEPFGIWREMP